MATLSFCSRVVATSEGGSGLDYNLSFSSLFTTMNQGIGKIMPPTPLAVVKISSKSGKHARYKRADMADRAFEPF